MASMKSRSSVCRSVAPSHLADAHYIGPFRIDSMALGNSMRNFYRLVCGFEDVYYASNFELLSALSACSERMWASRFDTRSVREFIVLKRSRLFYLVANASPGTGRILMRKTYSESVHERRDRVELPMTQRGIFFLSIIREK